MRGVGLLQDPAGTLKHRDQLAIGQATPAATPCDRLEPARRGDRQERRCVRGVSFDQGARSGRVRARAGA